MVATTYFWDLLEDNVVQSKSEPGVLANFCTEPSHFGQLIAIEASSSFTYFHADAQGSVLATTGNDGATTAEWSYTAFGVMLSSGSLIQYECGFVGKLGYRTNYVSGEILARHRLYLPKLAQWKSVDPVLSTFPYRYVQNRTTAASDPSGLVCNLEVKTETCQQKIARLLESNRLMHDILEIIKGSRCPKPDFICKRCNEDKNLSKATVAYFLAPNNDFFVCEDRGRPWEIEQTIAHELIHALDWCLTGQSLRHWARCEVLACSEIRAYSMTGNCDPGGIQYRQWESREACVRRSAADSIAAFNGQGGLDCNPAAMYVERVFAYCYESSRFGFPNLLLPEPPPLAPGIGVRPPITPRPIPPKLPRWLQNPPSGWDR